MNQIIMYLTEDGQTQINVRLENDIFFSSAFFK